MIRALLLTLVPLLALAGCATGDLRLAKALDAGRWDEAAAMYEAQLAANPDRLDARVGLGIVRYKLGSWPEAVATLEPAVARAPGLANARLYLGLAWLQQGELARADEQLTAYRGLVRDGRVAAQTDQALRLLKGDLNAEGRRFVAGSLETEAALSRDAEAARQDAQEYAYWGPPYWGPPYWGPPYWGPPYWRSGFWGYGSCWPYRRAARFACW